jgi:hypothetical protein
MCVKRGFFKAAEMYMCDASWQSLALGTKKIANTKNEEKTVQKAEDKKVPS